MLIHPLGGDDAADGREKEQELIPADSVVYCIGMIPRREFAESFAGLVYDVRIIGD